MKSDNAWTDGVRNNDGTGVVDTGTVNLRTDDFKPADTKTATIALDDITVTNRIRKDNGALDELAKSISERGLINPITVMENSDERYTLIAGLRRLEACRLLGMESVRATILTPMAADEALMIEIAENEQRKEFTVAERLDYAAKIKAVEKEKARERKSIYARDGYKSSQDVANRPHPDTKGYTRDIIAKKAGFTSQQQMNRVSAVANIRPDLLPKIDSGEMTIFGAYSKACNDEAVDDGEEGAHFVPDESTKDAPTVAQDKIRKRMTAEERAAVRRIEEQIVTANPVEVKTITLFNPMSVQAEGDENTVEGASHERLLSNAIYAALFEHYQETVETANVLGGELRSRCEDYEKRIRAYEENQHSMRWQIDSLIAERDDLLSQRTEAQNAGT